MESHFFRTLLETALAQHFPDGHPFNIRGLPRKKTITFHDYAKLAFDRMMRQIPQDNTQPSPTTASTSTTMPALLTTLDTIYSDLKAFYPHVNVSLLLRSIMSPVLESFILLDRFLYLQEHGAYPFLIPLFDESLSPRNMVLIAFK